MIWKGEMVSPLLRSGIVVRPFENLSANGENTFFADSIQDGILTKLASVSELKVVSRTSILPYRGARSAQQIGNALNVSHVLEGSVRRSAGKFFVNVQLVDTRTDTHVWAESYESDLNGVFAIQSEIAKKVAGQLEAKVSSVEKASIEEPPTTDLVAYDLYLRATDLINGILFSSRAKQDLLDAIQLLDQAVARDRSFATAYYQLAGAHDRLYFLGFDHTDSRIKLAEAAIQSIRGLRPDSGEAHLAFAQHLYWTVRDYDHARKELAAARRLLPNESRIPLMAGYIDRRQGLWEKSLEE